MSLEARPGTIPQWTIGDRFRKAREQLLMSQVELAEISGLSRRTIISIEKGEKRPRRKEYILVAFATGVPLYWLARGETPPEGPDGLPHLDSNQEPIGIKPALIFRGSAGLAPATRAA